MSKKTPVKGSTPAPAAKHVLMSKPRYVFHLSYYGRGTGAVVVHYSEEEAHAYTGFEEARVDMIGVSLNEPELILIGTQQ
jgi:hypothetical protein